MARGGLTLTGKTHVRHWRLLDGWITVKLDRFWLTRFPRDAVDWWYVLIRWGKPSDPYISNHWDFKILDVSFSIALWNRKRRAI